MAGMALEALHFSLLQLGYGLPAPCQVKASGTFSGTREAAASSVIFLYYEVVMCHNKHTHA